MAQLALASALLAGCFGAHDGDRAGAAAPRARDAGNGATDGGVVAPVDAWSTDASPTLDARTSPSDCHSTAASHAILPTVLLSDQPLAMTVVGQEGFGEGCGCTPRLADYGTLQTCGCCEGCDCIDAPYEAGRTYEPLPVGVHSVGIPHGEAQVQVFRAEDCREVGLLLTEVDMTIRPSSAENRTLGGERLDWVQVTFHSYCCSAPIPAVRHRIADDGAIELETLNCSGFDFCDCVVREPVPLSVWHNLGDLGPGSHIVRLGDVTRTFER